MVYLVPITLGAIVQLSVTPIEPPSPTRPLPEHWGDNLIIWEDWENRSDEPGFYCQRIDPWEREELEQLFTPAPIPLVLTGAVGATSTYIPGGYVCPHCHRMSADPATCKGALYLPVLRNYISATRCPFCFKDTIYTAWDNVLWDMEESDYNEENYMSDPTDGSSPWAPWREKLKLHTLRTEETDTA